MPASSARAAAFDILLQVEEKDAYASDLLNTGRYCKLPGVDHALATEIVMGVLRWRSRLDDEIEARCSQDLKKVDLEVLVALRIAAYQLLFLDRIPARAAVDESVELVKRARKRSAAGFVNAILRKLAGDANSIRNSNMELLAEGNNALPDTAKRFAHPAWLLESWAQQFGREAVAGICAFNQGVPQPAVRLFDAAAGPDVSATGVELGPGKLLASARRVLCGDVTKTPSFADGRLVIQDEASQLVALLVGKGSRILDCCAAPGGKTRLLAERNPNAEILAVELHAHRAQLLRKRVPNRNVHIMQCDIRELPVSSLFDRVLADVPCSGTGTLARHPEIKWRLTRRDVNELQSRQLAILQAAMAHVSPGGVLVYSTCSLEREENSDVVEKAIAESTFRLLDCSQELERLEAEGELIAPYRNSLLQGPYLRTIPGMHPVDGFFAAMLERTA
jgi:16S rRNA (cytosine967-C5)-methyltransferase